MSKPRASGKELRGLLRAVELEGGRITRGGRSGHWKVYRCNGDGDWHYVATVAGTPSDWAGLRSAVRELRRKGFTLEGFH